MKQIYIITIVSLLNFNFLNSQTVTVNDNTPNATSTIYTFTYTTTGEIGTPSTTPNIFLMNLPSGFPSITNTIPDSNLLGSNVVLKVNGTPITIDATTFGTIGGAWSGGIQMSVAGASVGLTIPAGATIEVIITNLIINPATTGPFTFDWKTANGGGASTEDFSATLTTLSIDDFINNTDVKIYPNPFNDFVNIHTESNSQIEVYNLLGKRILIQNINKGNSKINVSEYETGIYLFKITNENLQIKTMKVIKR
ncbi:T9SS type A sorting domain-containing protein [Pontimicrobium sp. SW4]|uniref:T9SS type A sorting domain-containing protein n=1 Tax=Pontimicrobium sp. SW4 TaxID=3153519 RepID=A0AAU7BUG8_9FLAO